MKKNLIFLLGVMTLASCQWPSSLNSEQPSSSLIDTAISDESTTSTSTSSSAVSESEVPEGYVPFDPRNQIDDPDIVNTDEYYEFWDSASKITLHLMMSKQNIKRVSLYGKDKNDPGNDLYFPGDLTLTMNGKIYVFAEVGVRMKGNTSRVDFAPEGEIIKAANFKLSFNETWDKSIYQEFPDLYKTWTKNDEDFVTRDKRTLFGMKKLDLKWNRSNDPAICSQPFINRFYGGEENGCLYVPRSTLGEFIMSHPENAMNMGIYILNEPIDKTMIRRFIKKGTKVGDLYKCTYNSTGPASLNLYDAVNRHDGVYTPKGNWINEENLSNGTIPPYEIKTNEDKTDHQALIQLMRALYESEGKSSAEVEAALNAVIDIPAFLLYAATAYLVGNPDDLRNNFNNYYIYFDKETNKATFIPYDNDWALGIGYDDSVGLKMADLSPLHIKRSTSDNIQPNPLYWYLIINETQGNLNYSNRYPVFTAYQNQYVNNVRRLFNSELFSQTTFNNLYNRYRHTYRNVESDLNTNSSFKGVHIFNEYHQRLQTAIYK